jgi:GNAT superfamily N-acetyltransferase
MSPPVIRPATIEDFTLLAPRLAALPLFTAYGLEAARLAARWTEGLAKGDGLLVAESGGALLGLCWFLRRGVFGTGGYLRTIALVPEAVGQGVGPLLLKAFEDGCDRPSGGWFLLTSDFNEGAQRFYQRHGYSEVGRLPGFAAPHITELIFWKPRPG